EVDAGADAALVFSAMVAETRAELHRSDRRLVATLTELGSTPSLPLATLTELGSSRRELLWQNTLRALVVDTARLTETSEDDAFAEVAKAREAGAEGRLVVAELELTAQDAADAAAAARAAADATGRLVVWLPALPSETDHERLLDLHSRRQALDHARRANETEIVAAGERAGEADATMAREILRRLYFEGTLAYPTGGELLPVPPADLASLSGLAFERQIPRLADPLLARLHPLHASIAPRGELVGDRLLQRLVYDVLRLGRVPPGAMSQLRPLVDGYLVPLGLARSRRDGAAIAPDPARSPAVSALCDLVGDRDHVPATEVVAYLADGPLGLTAPESILLLNACVGAGLLEMVRGRKRATEPFLAVTPIDRLMAGELVEQAVRETITQLGPVVGPGPFEPWTAATQRDAWQHTKAWLEVRQEELAQVADGRVALESIPALGGADTKSIEADAATVRTVIEVVEASAPPAPGLRALAAAIDDPETMLAAVRRLARVARFFRDDLRRVDDASRWLAHPDLRLPDDQPALRSLHANAVRMVEDTLERAAEDRSEDLFRAFSEVRNAYLAVYQEAHDRHYASAGPDDVRAVQGAPQYQALVALSAAGVGAVPDDQVKVDRALSIAAPRPCTRRVDQE
ncbi:MAG: hypothetical protein ACRDWE_09255, partial [Acidimicrobiales bacterium]